MKAAVETPAASIPERLGKHRIVGKLATGGMASVFLARLVGPGGFENIVVLKRMLPHLAEDARFREMFVDEARTVAKIRHPNVVRTFELVEEKDDLYLVMEYLEGETLQRLSHALLSQSSGLSLGLACYVVSEAAAGLHAAHELLDEDGVTLGVVHRDVSPHNLFITHDGTVKVIDFGIAKSVDQANQTSTGEFKGKFAYMAPEQVGGRGTTRRTDVFALGIVLWELLSGKRLYQRENQMVTLRAVSDEPTPPPSSVKPTVPASLDAICARCLAKDPAERYASMAELRKDLLQEMRKQDEHDPQGELSRTMQALFEKTIAQRRTMLRESRAGEEAVARDVTTIDVTYEDAPTQTAAVNRRPDASVAVPVEPPPRNPRVIAAVAIGVIAVVSLGAIAVFSSSGAPDATPPIAPPATPAEPAPTLAATPTVVPPTPPEPGVARVHIVIESDPIGALVTVGGIARGNTPLTLDLPRGDEAIPLELTLEGRRATSTLLMPDRDQSLRLSLARPSRGGAPRAGGSATEGSEGSGEERGGFFAFE